MLNVIIFFFSLCCCCRCRFVLAATEIENVTAINIGVILQLDLIGKVAKPAFELAAEDVNKLLNSSHERLVLHFRDSKGDPIEAASAAVELLQSQVVAIIGPQTSQEAGFVAQLCDRAQVPMVSFSATDRSLSSQRFPYFMRLPHSDAVQMRAIAALVHHYEWRQVVAIYTDNNYGTNVLPSLSEYLRDVGSEIAYRLAIPTNASKVFIKGELYKLMTMQTRVFVVHMTFELGQVLFSVARDIGMMDDEYVWIITEGFSTVLGALEASALGSMRGVLGTKSYIPRSVELHKFDSRWKQRFRVRNPSDPAKLNIYAYYAYDAVSVIAGAVQKLANHRFSFSEPPLIGTSELTHIKIFREGKRLMQLLSETDFRGLSGYLRAEGGEISGAQYEILNVLGENQYPTVGLWMDRKTGIATDIGNLSGLENVTWPGGSQTAPPGWATPADRHNVLKIGVPVKSGFNQFIETKFSGTKATISRGFVIDVFDEVLKRLPYAFPYKFYPYGNGNVTPSYDELIGKVYRKEYDALVGDVTILATRSNQVDFTQPFSESGLVMVVPIKKADSSNAWAFLQPFTPGMWIATVAFFLFTGIVVWVLEHKRNTTFRGKPAKQVITLLWFSFSTLFFSQREKIVSSLARGVIIIWLFVVLIVTSSYTASLTSILMVKQMEPTITDVQSLITSRAPVGYLTGSFVRHYLQEQLGFDGRQLKEYSTPEEYAAALSKGPENGGVAAIFDEVPYLRVFLSTQCGYTMVGPTYRTGGFGFAFPKGSPFVSDISTAVLELSESPEMQRIENKWFNSTACTKAGAQVDSDSLSMESFWGLYLITGTASIVALLLFVGRLLYGYTRHSPVPSNSSISTHFKSFVSYMDRREPSSPGRNIFRTGQYSNSNHNIGNHNPNYTPEFRASMEERAMSMRTVSTSCASFSEGGCSSGTSSFRRPWVYRSRDVGDVVEEDVQHEGP